MTTMPPTDERLDAILASIGEHLDIGDQRARPIVLPAHRPYRRPLAVAAAIVLAFVVAITAVAPARDAVADFLHIGSTRIDRVPTPPTDSTAPATTLPGLLDGLERIDATAATARLGRALPDTGSTGLGPPDAIYANRNPGDGVIVAWTERSATLWIHRTTVPDAIIYAKQLGGPNRVEPISGLGDSAIAITGPHTLQTPDRTIAAGNVVLWIRNGWEYRLEADRPVAELTAIARSIGT